MNAPASPLGVLSTASTSALSSARTTPPKYGIRCCSEPLRLYQGVSFPNRVPLSCSAFCKICTQPSSSSVSKKRTSEAIPAPGSHRNNGFWRSPRSGSPAHFENGHSASCFAGSSGVLHPRIRWCACYPVAAVPRLINMSLISFITQPSPRRKGTKKDYGSGDDLCQVVFSGTGGPHRR